MLIKVDREKLEKALSLLGDNAPKLEDLAPQGPPAYYVREAWNRARVKFDEFVPGAYAMLAPASVSAATALRKAIVAAPNGDIDLSIEAQAQLFRACLTSVGTDKASDQQQETHAAIFNTEPPLRGAKIEDWMPWAGNLAEAIATRLAVGILIFRNEEFDQKNG